MDKEGNKIAETLAGSLPKTQTGFCIEDKFIFPSKTDPNPTDPSQVLEVDHFTNELSEKKDFLLKQFLPGASCVSNETGTDPRQGQHQDNLNISRLRQFSITITPDAEQGLSLYKLKLNWIIYLLSNIKYTQCLVFFNDKGRGDQLLAELEELGMNKSCLYIHGEMSQEKRIRLMNKVKLRNSRVIISTDLLSRGIDIDGIDMVIN